MPDQLDPSIIALTKAIRQSETGNKPEAGASGEGGRYQWMPGTWQDGAKQYLGDANAPMTLENENKVAYNKIKVWKEQGYNPAQIASLWNSHRPDWRGNVGVNLKGVAYNTPQYVKNVYGNYQKFSSSIPASQKQPAPQQKSSLLGDVGKVLGGAAKAIAKPFAEVGTSALNLGSSVQDLAFGQFDKAAKDISATRDVPLLGKTQPALTGTESTKEVAGKSLKYGADIAGVVAGGETAGATLGEGVLKGAALGAKQFATLGAVGGLGGSLEKPDRGLVGNIADTLLGGLSGGVTGGAIGGLLPVAAWGTTAVAKAGKELFDRVTTPLEERVTNVLSDSINKALKPSAASMRNTAYPELAQKAIRIINQFKSSFEDPASGEMVQRNPATRQELLQSLRGAKSQVFSVYNNIVKAATGEGAKVDMNPIADELLASTKTNIAKLRPEITTLLRKTAIGLRQMGQKGLLPADQALELTQQLNAGLQSFFARGNPNDVSGKAVDAFIVNKINEGLGSSVENTTGAQYAPWKKAYQALKTIESDVSRGAGVEARKASKGFFDITDIASGAELIKGLTTMNPADTAKAGFMFGLKKYYKYLNDPNTNIKKMFSVLKGAADTLPKQTPNVPL